MLSCSFLCYTTQVDTQEINDIKWPNLPFNLGTIIDTAEKKLEHPIYARCPCKPVQTNEICVRINF